MQAEERTEDEDEATPQTEDEGADSADDARTESEDDAGDSDGDAGKKKGSAEDVNASNAEGVAAPSIGPDTEIEREPPEDRLARHEQSTVDAMGNDKRRAVRDQSYGASKTRRLALYGAFIAVIAVVVIAVRFAISEFDKPRDRNGQEPAAWAQDEARDITPAPLSFPRNGKQDLEAPDSGLGDAEIAGQDAGAN